MARIIQIPVADVFVVNSYLYLDEESKHAFLIDPGAQAEDFLHLIEREGIVVKRILLTHGHFDHTGAVAEISKTLGVPYSIHREGLRYLTDTRLNLSSQCGRNVLLEDAEPFDDGDVFTLAEGDSKLAIIYTPGHTPDSCIFYSEQDKAAFVGDTIFKGSIGSDRYPGGDAKTLWQSITERILSLPPETTLLSGHSDPTNVGTERKHYNL